MPKVISWTPEQFKRNLKQRFEDAKLYREQIEPQWRDNHQTIMNANSSGGGDQFNLTFDNVVELEAGDVDGGDAEIGMNYAFKYLRFFHSQLSANPPSAIAMPRSTDPTDKRKADAADRIIRHAIKDKDLQEIFDRCSLKTLLYGTGWIKQVWDSNAGDVFDFNEETQEVNMEGDISITTPETFDIWIDPDAKNWEDVQYVIEAHTMRVDDAKFQFPDAAELLQKAVDTRQNNFNFSLTDNNPQRKKNTVKIYEYYEKGLPINGMAGRHAFFLEDGTLISKPGRNPHYKAKLPYHIFTYIDQPDAVYGKSTVEYVARLQDMLNRLDSNFLDNIQSHGVARLVLWAENEVEDESITNSSFDWIKVSGGRAPMYINPPTLMQDGWRFRDQLVAAIQELYGINDSMQGIQRREQSAISQQTAIEAGTMIHRRLFKKYSRVVENVYKDYLALARDNWEEPRTILVIGKEKAFEAADFKGSDIAGGFDLVVEYGASLPLDPNMKREALMLLQPLLKEAGMTAKQILAKMKLNDIEGIYDRMELSAERQREIFEEMAASYYEGNPIMIEPEDLQEHAGMLDFAYTYVMTSEFKHMPEELKELIKSHIRSREDMAAKDMAGGAQAQAAPDTEVAPFGMPGVGGATSPEVPTG